MTLVGLPHSEIPGSKRACRSPRHIAACHVLHRLSVPRHPPSTLSNLTIKCLDLMRSAVPLSSVGSSQFAVGRSFLSCLLPTAHRILRRVVHLYLLTHIQLSKKRGQSVP